MKHRVIDISGSPRTPKSMSSLPHLSDSVQQLASILPISTLIDFTDVPAKLHLYELSGSVPLWNWPITPSGARFLLSAHHVVHTCCLDLPERSAVLECFDGRYGDRYPCSSPTTTRSWVSTFDADRIIQNEHPNMRDPCARKQILQVIRLSESLSAHEAPTTDRWLVSLLKPIKSHVHTRSRRYNAGCWIGWTVWTVLVTIEIISGLYSAAIYLLLMPLSGIVIACIYGTKARMPLKRKVDRHDRLVVASSSVNACEWWAFCGDQTLVNALLNLPLFRQDSASIVYRGPLRCLLRLLIASQWGLALAACTLEGWDAIFISLWIAFCACMSSYAYPLDVGTKDWLNRTCNIDVEKTYVELSSRRSLLSALIYLNPDSKLGRTNWIDPILARSVDRHEWEQTLLSYLQDANTLHDPSMVSKYWWKFLLEGIEVGTSIQRRLKTQDEI